MSCDLFRNIEKKNILKKKEEERDIKKYIVHSNDLKFVSNQCKNVKKLAYKCILFRTIYLINPCFKGFFPTSFTSTRRRKNVVTIK